VTSQPSEKSPIGKARSARWPAAALLVALAGSTAAGLVTPAAACVAVGMLFASVLVVVLSPKDLRDLIRRVRKLSYGRGSIEFDRLSDQLDAVVGVDEEGLVDTDERDSNDLIALRFLLEAKLAYIAKDLLAEPVTKPRRDPNQKRTPSFATIGSLQYDEYLPDAEARLAVELLTLRDGDLKGEPKPKVDDLVRRTHRFVQSFRLIVFYGLTEVTIRKTGGYCCLVNPRSKQRRPDLVAHDKNSGRELLVVPVFAVPGSPATVRKTVKRLNEGSGGQPKVAHRIIVVPNPSNDPAIDNTLDDVKVIRVERLRETLLTAASTARPAGEEGDSFADRESWDEHESEEDESPG
jgi:hypothetical protein